MIARLMTWRWAVLGSALLTGAILAGGVVAGQFRGPEDPDRLEAALREAPMTRVADIAPANGLSGRGVFVQTTATGLVCLWDMPTATSSGGQGGCNSADDPLGGRKLMISFAYDGGPAVADVRDARLIGLAAVDTAAVHVLMSDGTRRKLALRKTQAGTGAFLAFGHRISRGELRRNVTPTTVVALDEAGQEIDRQATGFTG